MSSDFNVIATRWVKEVAGCSCHFRLVFDVASIITSFLPMSLVALSILLVIIYCAVAEVYWPSIDNRYRWFQLAFAYRHVQDLVEAVILSWNRGASGAIGAYRLCAARGVVWVVPCTERCSLASAVVDMCPSSQVGPEVFNSPPVSPSVPPVFNADLQ